MSQEQGSGFVRSGSRILVRFPVTILLLGQYTPLVVVPAIRYQTAENSAFMVGLVALAVLVAFAVEACVFPLGNLGKRTSEFSTTGIIAMGAIGFLAAATAALQGAGSYETQIGVRDVGRLASVFTPLQPWTLAAPALALYLAAQGRVSKKMCIAIVGVSLGLTLAHGLFIARLAPVMTYSLALAFCAFVLRIVRFRWIFLSIVIATLAWPILFNARNQERYELGGRVGSVGDTFASDRLRLDKNLALAKVFEAPPNMGEPTLLQMVRYGIVPRALDPDPDRATVSTGQLLNAALGGSTTSAFSFTVLGNVYVLDRLIGVVAYVFFLTLAMAIALRRRGAFALVIAVFMVQQCFWIESTYPDGFGALLQGTVSTAVGFLFLRIWDRLFMRSRRSRRTRLSPAPAGT